MVGVRGQILVHVITSANTDVSGFARHETSLTAPERITMALKLRLKIAQTKNVTVTNINLH